MVLWFAFGALLSTWLQWERVFGDPDAFYHAGLSEYMMEDLVISHFSWLPFTTLADHFADHHFLYHLLMIPFIYLVGNPLVAIKVLTVLLFALATSLFYLFLRRSKVLYPSLFTLLLLLSAPFVFRMNLNKANVLSLCLILIFFSLLFSHMAERKKMIFLAFLSFLYVWSHGSFPLLVVFIILYALASGLDRAKEKVNFHSSKEKNPGKLSEKAKEWKRLMRECLRGIWETRYVFLSVLIGLALGLVINPYFPENLWFYKEQIFEVAVKNYGDRIEVGGEWHGYKVLNLAEDLRWISILFLPSLLAFIVYLKDQRRESFFFLLSGAVFFVMTLLSNRHVEYFVPLALLAMAFVLQPFLKRWPPRRIEKFFAFLPRPLYSGGKWILLFAIFWLGMINIGGAYSTLHTLQIPFGKYRQASEWMNNNLEEKALVFHSRWDEFPMLFYRARQFRYLAGLDPTFFYRGDKERFGLHQAIQSGRFKGDVSAAILEKFHSRHVFIEKNRHQNMVTLIERDSDFKKVFENPEVVIFFLPPQ